MTKHLTILIFLGLAFWGCEENTPDYIICKWFAYAGWQETDSNCSNYRQYTLGWISDSTVGTGFGYGNGVIIDNYIHYYETDNYLELGFKTDDGDGIDYTETTNFQDYIDIGKNICIEYERK